MLVIIPDGTRTMPMPFMFDAIERALGPRVQALDFLVALGTHAPMSDAALSKHVGRPVVNGRAGSRRIFNHQWDDPSTFLTLGSIPAARGRRAHRRTASAKPIPVALNRLVVEYDHVIICGPVFPHEVVGLLGRDEVSVPGHRRARHHPLHALARRADDELQGHRHRGHAGAHRSSTARPVCSSTPLSLLALVVTHDGRGRRVLRRRARTRGAQAASLSASRHIVWVDRPFKRVLSVMPAMYDDLWTAAKGMYKTEPVVADDGEVVIYAPHVGEVSFVHGRIIDEIGYHCRDYFTAQWDRFKQYPGGILAHSTHVKGLGAFDASNGRETPRIRVTLATGIPRERCDRINLEYADPATIDPQQLSRRCGHARRAARRRDAVPTSDSTRPN